MTDLTDDAAIRALVMSQPSPLWAETIPELMAAVKKRSGAPGSLADVRKALWRAGYIPDQQRVGGPWFLPFATGEYSGRGGTEP